MKDREAAAVCAAGLCIITALLRMLAPELPFDWMTLVLILAAAAALVAAPLLAGGRRAKRPDMDARPVPAQSAESNVPAEMEALRMRMAQVEWSAGKGGLFDALKALHRDKPFSALCAARGTLHMLLAQTALSAEDSATLSLLVSAMDAAARMGEAASDPATVDALFSYAMRALGGLEGTH